MIKANTDCMAIPPATDAIFTPNTATDDWSLSVTSRASGSKIEEITQNDTITTTSVITSLSVFSQ